ncbi:het domain protein [Colletotrichum musicola]|uniref:Het domain protein n=1 Tax=Colletotrichum musicola TaxID=2175873 RepID=A0A8H6N861_9PEZI|nr:het domain protein [Colletotrichum musicola]
MRLLNATTLQIDTVLPGREPPYAILSHRWTDDEVMLGDVQSRTAHRKASSAKLKGCCDVALSQGLSHVSIDTCCIDQTSSAELSEAINSMFRWYRGAQVCYAYLFDACGEDDYLQSQWFERGWTLQELIAPKECLLGIFNIHMPLLYGEGGENAFIRLQREIISNLNSADDSWLAWGLYIPQKGVRPRFHDAMEGMLAKSPSLFKDSWDVVLVQRGAGTAALRVSVTNADIHVQLPVVTKYGWDELLLGCQLRSDYWSVISIPVINHLGRYYRKSGWTKSVDEELWSGATALNMNSTWGNGNVATLKDLILASGEYIAAEVTGKDANT